MYNKSMENFFKKIDEIIIKDNRYKPDAYEFVMQALWFTQARLKKQGHLTGKELLAGIKDFVLEQYGPMAKAVFKHWGIERTKDFGDIVFNMVDSGLLNKTETDSRDDFENVFDFDEAFDIFKNRAFEKLGTNPKRSQLNSKQKTITSKPAKQKDFGSKNLN